MISDDITAYLVVEEIHVMDPGNHSPCTWRVKDDRGEWIHSGIGKEEYALITDRGKERGKRSQSWPHRAPFPAPVTLSVVVRNSPISLEGGEQSLLPKAMAQAHLEAKRAEQRALFHVIGNILRGKKNSKKKKDKRKKWTKQKADFEDTTRPGAKVVVIGDGGHTSGMKGATSSAPVAKIKRLAVKPARCQGWHFGTIRKAYTSKNSNCCPGFTRETNLTVTRRGQPSTAESFAAQCKGSDVAPTT